MTLSQIKREVNALKRKYAKALAVVRLRRLAQEFCEELDANREEGKPAMNTVESGQWFIKRGYRPRSLNRLFDCIRRSTEQKEAPKAYDIVKALIPWPWGKYRTIIDNIFTNRHLFEDRPPRRAPQRRSIDPADLPPVFPIMAREDWPWDIDLWFPIPSQEPSGSHAAAAGPSGGGRTAPRKSCSGPEAAHNRASLRPSRAPARPPDAEPSRRQRAIAS